MRQTLFLLFFSFPGFFCFAQSSEFEPYDNGLIYSDTTVKQLKYIVDSLNLKFRVCELDKVYLSKPQAKAHHVFLEKHDVKAAKADIEAGISYEDFLRKYKQAETVKELLVVKYKYQNYKGKNIIELSSVGFDDKYQYGFKFDGDDYGQYDKPLKDKWIYRYTNKSKYDSESISAFYFTEDFSKHPLPEKYARMVQYSDCMVDTSTQVFYESANESSIWSSARESAAPTKFMDYIDKSTNKPDYEEYEEKDQEKYWENYQLWDSLKFSRVDSLRKTDAHFATLLNEAVTEALETGASDEDFELYVELYYSPKTALELKRNRIVVGGCSQDQSPRFHALNIARLSAETTSWELFLRAHLDIMNDRFDRVTDGSYAWEGRKTYIRELEVLDINVLDLLLGISLRIENPSSNHYYGSIGRLGRALSETRQADEIESKMLEMISDNTLDDYNRILMYYLFLNYNYNLENEDKQAKNKEKLAGAVKALPEYLSSKIIIK